MKNYSSCFFLVFVLLWNVQLFSQEDPTSYNNNLEVQKKSNFHDLVLYSDGGKSSNLNVNQQLKINQIFIQQIGENNIVNSSITSQEGNLDIIQLGNNNFTSLETTVNRIEGAILQYGNDNFSLTSVNDPNRDLFLNVNMNGNGHHLESYGVNAIGNKLSIEMTGESQAIIVKNFN